MKVGEVRSQGGLTFTRLPAEVMGLERETERAKAWRWFRGADGPAVLQWFLGILVRVEPRNIEGRSSKEAEQTNHLGLIY
jgi:hypothetical protein